jgi:hypothetical protein
MSDEADRLHWGRIEAEEIAGLVGVCGGEARRSPDLGTKGLMLAVLEEGIRDYLSAREGVRARAEAWVRGAGPPSVFSFTVVCETLGLEPTSVRAALRRMRGANSPARAIGRSRPNARRRATLG